MTYLKDSRGAALPLTLVVILVLAILGVSLLTVASSSHSMQASQHRRLAARHIAEGGAETVYQAIKTSSSSVVYGHPFTVNLGNQPGNPTASVTVEELEDDTVLITSTGTYGSASATVKLAAIPGLPEVYTLGVYKRVREYTERVTGRRTSCWGRISYQVARSTGGPLLATTLLRTAPSLFPL